MAHRVGLRCDGSPQMGVGHLIRSLALGDELLARGVEVVMLSAITDLPWVEEQVRERSIAVVPPSHDPDELVDQCRDLGLDAVVLDGYDLDTLTGERLQAAGLRVLALVDGPFGERQRADLYLDQNLGAEPLPSLPPGAQMLTGLDYALFRDQVVSRRAAGAERGGSGAPPRVLAVFGGTDPYAAAPVVVPLLLETGMPVHVLAIAARPEIAEQLRGLACQPGQRVEVIDPVHDLAGVAVTCDAAVSAAGSSVWELLCIGVPSALVAVADNQEVGYQQVVAKDVIAPLGRLGELRASAAARAAAVAALGRLVGDPAYRAVLRDHGMRLLDGRGRERVADALLGMLG